jgi:hypothetical protein
VFEGLPRAWRLNPHAICPASTDSVVSSLESPHG